MLACNSNIKVTMEREENQKLPFLDVLLENHSNQGIITSVFHKKTYTGLLTNCFSFVPFSYKLGLVRTLVDRIFKINNTWAGFHLDIHVNNLTKMLRKNSFPSSVIENVVRKFRNNYFTPDSTQSVARKDNCLYFKLPYIGPFSIITQRRIKELVNTLCSDLEIKLVFKVYKMHTFFLYSILNKTLSFNLLKCIFLQFQLNIIFTSWYDVSHAMGFRGWGRN